MGSRHARWALPAARMALMLAWTMQLCGKLLIRAVALVQRTGANVDQGLVYGLVAQGLTQELRAGASPWWNNQIIRSLRCLLCQLPSAAGVGACSQLQSGPRATVQLPVDRLTLTWAISSSAIWLSRYRDCQSRFLAFLQPRGFLPLGPRRLLSRGLPSRAHL